MSRQAELLDLPDVQERPQVKICTPKLMILGVLACYFIGQNMYHYLTKPTPINSTPPPVETDKWAQFMQIYDKFQNYIFVTIIGFALFIYLRRSNDRYEEEQYLKAKAQEQRKEEQQRRLQSEREQRIIRKLEEEERAAQEKQMRMAAENEKKLKSKANEKQKES